MQCMRYGKGEVGVRELELKIRDESRWDTKQGRDSHSTSLHTTSSTVALPPIETVDTRIVSALLLPTIKRAIHRSIIILSLFRISINSSCVGMRENVRDSGPTTDTGSSG